MATEPPIPPLWYELTLMFAAKYGEPLPKELLEFTDPIRGLVAKLNNTSADVDNIPQFGIFLYVNEWPLGLVDPAGGTLIVASGCSEPELIQWAREKAHNEQNVAEFEEFIGEIYPPLTTNETRASPP